MSNCCDPHGDPCAICEHIRQVALFGRDALRRRQTKSYLCPCGCGKELTECPRYFIRSEIRGDSRGRQEERGGK